MTPPSRRDRRIAAGWTLGAALLGLAPAAPAQNPCPPPMVVEAWADPYYGNDDTAVVGDVNLPFGTIQAGIDALAADPAVVADGAHGLLHLMPGIYSSTASQVSTVPGAPSQNQNSETFPIVMAPRVSVQGTGAKECVVQVSNFFEGHLAIPWPDAASGCSGALPRFSRSVAFDFSSVGAEAEEMLDGITIQGSDVQVLAWARSPITARISNCVFDMRILDYPLYGPTIGILTTPEWDRENETYPALHLSVFNNTFIQAWKLWYPAEQIMSSVQEAVAICDVNDPGEDGDGADEGGDPNPEWRGVSALHVQNNLVRTLDGLAPTLAPRTAFLGLDAGDTMVVKDNGAIVPTNAFGAGLVGGSNATGSLCSEIVGASPVPAVDTFVNDPAFFGEWHNSRFPGSSIFDSRLLPTSPLVDAGQAPEPPSEPCLRILTALNGLVHVQLPNPSLERRVALDSFDLDGEGHGNPRVVGGNVDIGFDETDALLIGGSYGANTKSHNLPWDPALAGQVSTGAPRRVMVSPTAAPFAYHFNMTPMPNAGMLLRPTWNVMPGSLAVPAILAPGPVYSWVSTGAGYTNAGTFTPVPVTWTNWVDNSSGTKARRQVHSGATSLSLKLYSTSTNTRAAMLPMWISFSTRPPNGTDVQPPASKS